MSNAPMTDAATEHKERLIRIMGTFDLATGHADSWDDLLDSLQSELRDVLGHYRARKEYAASVEVGAIAWQDQALAHLAVVRVLMSPQDVLRVQDFINDSRVKGEPVDHGYDRTASLNAGHYVCTCGGACSSPITGEQSK